MMLKTSFPLYQWLVLALCIGVAAATPAYAAKRRLRATGIALTGPNDRCGEPVWSFPLLPAGPESRGTLLGIEDPDPLATDATPLAAADCGKEGDPALLLATTTDPAFFAVRGWPDPDERIKNLRLRQVPVPAGNGVRAPIPLPGIVPPNPLPPTIARPTDPITLGTWLDAGGSLKITCNDKDGTASVKIGLRKLVPHGVYTAWGVWQTGDPELLFVPFGGLPNTIVPNRKGKATFQREIDFCPLDFAPDGSSLMFVSIAYHADAATYGAVPAEPFTTRVFVGLGFPFQTTIPPGTVTFDHVGFRVNAGEIP